MLPCDGCAYRRELPGHGGHLRCAFAWEAGELLRLLQASSDHGLANGWFMFPFNYDPRWGPEVCPNRSTTVDSARLVKTPLHELIGLMKRG